MGAGNHLVGRRRSLSRSIDPESGWVEGRFVMASACQTSPRKPTLFRPTTAPSSEPDAKGRAPHPITHFPHPACILIQCTLFGTPLCNFCTQAREQDLYSRQDAIFAYRPNGKYCIQARVQESLSGLKENFASRLASVQNMPFWGMQNLHLI